MATYTKNINLEKPEQNEYYDIEIFNANSNKIDDAYKELEDKITKLENNKLDKGNYLGNAQDLKDDIDNRLINHGTEISFGDTQNPITTQQFIEILKEKGAFKQSYWVSRCSWAYAENSYITDSGLGNIHLAGAVIEAFGNTLTHTVRITMPTTEANGGENEDFIYINNGPQYFPGWRKLWNSKNFNPDSKLDKGTYIGTAQDLKGEIDLLNANKLNISGGYINSLLIGKNGISNISLGIGDVDTGFNKTDIDGEIEIISNGEKIGIFNKTGFGYYKPIFATGNENSIICSKGTAGCISEASKKRTGFNVGDGAGGALIVSGDFSTYTKGYQIATETGGKGYLAESNFGHLRSGGADYGSTLLYFEGSYAGSKVNKIWEFVHNTGDFKLPGKIYENGQRVVSQYDINQQTLLWQGTAYSMDFTLPVGTWSDFLYVGCAGNNQSGVLDCNMINQLPIGTTILVGYGQGGVDHYCNFTKTSNNSGRFVQSGSGSTGGSEQTFPINYIFARRFKY